MAKKRKILQGIFRFDTINGCRCYILSGKNCFLVSTEEENKFLLDVCGHSINQTTVGQIIENKKSEVEVYFETPVKNTGKHKWAYSIKPANQNALIKWAKTQ